MALKTGTWLLFLVIKLDCSKFRAEFKFYNFPADKDFQGAASSQSFSAEIARIRRNYRHLWGEKRLRGVVGGGQKWDRIRPRPGTGSSYERVVEPGDICSGALELFPEKPVDTSSNHALPFSEPTLFRSTFASSWYAGNGKRLGLKLIPRQRWFYLIQLRGITMYSAYSIKEKISVPRLILTDQITVT